MEEFQEVGMETTDIFPVCKPIMEMVSPQTLAAQKLSCWKFATAENL